MEMKLNRENSANDPAVGYNVLPQVASELMAAAERLATSSRVKGHWELPEP